MLACIIGYLARRILSGHELLSKCRTCREVLLSKDTVLDDPVLMFMHFKVFDTKFIPSEKFLDHCTHWENVFCKEFDVVFCKDNMTRDNIGHLLDDVIRNLDAYKELRVCSNKMKSQIVAIFVNVHIQHALKFKNKQLMDLTLKRKCRKINKKSQLKQTFKMLTMNGTPYVVSSRQLPQ